MDRWAQEVCTIVDAVDSLIDPEVFMDMSGMLLSSSAATPPPQPPRPPPPIPPPSPPALPPGLPYSLSSNRNYEAAISKFLSQQLNQ